MTQQVIPGKREYPKVMTPEERKELRIAPAEPSGFGGGIQGYFRPGTGEIYLGTFEFTTIQVLIHEIIHKVIYETENTFKSTFQWDNIAREIETDFFNMDFNKWMGDNYKEAVKHFGSEEAYLKFIGVK